MVLAKLLSKATGLEEIEASLLLPLSFIEYYAERKRKRRKGSTALATALALPLTLIAFALLLLLTEQNPDALALAPPFSWQTVGLVWAYALGFTAVIVLLLTAIAVILLLASLSERYASTSTMPRV